MNKQVVLIHGGSTFDTHEEYIDHLHNTKIQFDRLISSRGWKDNLADDLGKEYEVLQPHMPNGSNAKYSEWKIWFERITPFFKKDTILLGHSLGGIFLAKYLSENNIDKKIKAVILVSAPYDDESEECLGDFKISSSLDGLSKQVGEIYLVQSKDDPVVPFTELEKYKKALPTAKTKVLPKGGHFNEESFPEIIKLVKKL